MSIEELLKPRYKVIADYPNSGLDEGEILEKNIHNDWFFKKNKKYGLPLSQIICYPHLFKKLEWWEDRKESDMPKYVIDKENKSIRYKVYGWLQNNAVFQFGESEQAYTHTEFFLPSTKEEFENQN